MKTTALAIVIAVVYGIAGFLLYRARVIHHSFWLDSDLVVFFIPAVLAWLTNGLLIWSLFRRRILDRSPLGAIVAISFALTLITALVYCTIAFNTFGT